MIFGQLGPCGFHGVLIIEGDTQCSLAMFPVVVDAGIGAPSHAAEAMEMGASAVLVNTAIAVASDPVRMAIAFKKAVEAGREAYEAGLGSVSFSLEANASSPLTAFLNQ